MNTKLLCVTVLIFTILIFWGNHSAARNEFEPQDECEPCRCEVQLVSTMGIAKEKEPSCSIIFKGPGFSSTESITKAKPLVFPFACDFAVFCDRTHAAKARCAGSDTQAAVDPSQKCTFQCRDGDLRWNCDNWQRKQKKSDKKKKKSGSLGSGGVPSWIVLASTNIRASIMPSFLLAKYSDQDTDDPETKETITGPNRWRVIDGEAGIEKGGLMVADGEAEAQSFCTGDTIRLAGPGVISLPTCLVDITGRWHGVYTRRLPTKRSPPVAVSLELRNESGGLRGEVKTTDGTFNIISARQNDTNIQLEAAGSVEGKERKILFSGKLTKGDIVFDGSESGIAEKPLKLLGAVRRMYIADSALLPAVLNQPYNFTLTAISPDSQPITFRLAAPATATATAITRPKINWFTQANSLGARSGERFTYICPANGSLSGFLAGTDSYKDDSSVCKAAVHSGLITLQAGGPVTVQFQPGAQSYAASTRNGVSSDRSGAWKGSFVFAAGDDSSRTEPTRSPLPPGLSFDASSGTFSGTPTETGNFNIRVTAADAAGNVFEQSLTLAVKKMMITTRLLPDAFFGQPYSATLKVVGGQPPYHFSGIPPKGLTLDPNTGAISGTPTSSRTNPSQFTIRDSQNNSETQDVSLQVRRTTILTSHFLPEATQGSPYHMQFTGVGNNIATQWLMTGEAQDELIKSLGLTLDRMTGELSGTPTKPGEFLLSLGAITTSVDQQYRTFTLGIKPGGLPGRPKK